MLDPPQQRVFLSGDFERTNDRPQPFQTDSETTDSRGHSAQSSPAVRHGLRNAGFGGRPERLTRIIQEFSVPVRKWFSINNLSTRPS